MKTAKDKYWQQKTQARLRKLEFTLTFEQWYDIWQQSGKWEQRGRKKGQYVMSRIGDNGGYTPENVFIQSNADNNRDAAPNRTYTKKSFINRTPWNKGMKTGPLSLEHKEKLSLIFTGIPKTRKKELANG